MSKAGWRKKDLVKYGPETLSTDFSIPFQSQCISEHYLLNIFIKEIQPASRLDDSCNKLIATNYFFTVF